MAKLILLRHGQSTYNLNGKFTGWTDVALTPQGIEEAKNTAVLLIKKKISVDICFSSFLKRAIKTAWIILEQMNAMHVDHHHSWKLNERHYGQWQGKSKNEVKDEMTDEEYEAIHRGNDTPPPALDAGDERHPRFDPKYKQVNPGLLPAAESLSDTEKRVVNYYFEGIVPHLMRGANVLVSAHGNSLRALMERLQSIDAGKISELEVPTGKPYLYEYDNQLNLLDHGIIK